MCDWGGCEAKREFRPVISIRTNKGRETSGVLRVVYALGYCLACKSPLKLSDVLTDEGWEHVSTHITKRHGAEIQFTRDDARLDWCRLNSKEGRSVANQPPSIAR
jgi:hypothetical protein